MSTRSSALLAAALVTSATRLAAAQTASPEGLPADDGAEAKPSTMAPRPVALESIRYRPGEGLELRSADDDFTLTTRLRAQFLYQLDRVPNAADAQSFQVQRARVQFTGNLFGKHNRYKVQLAFSPRDQQRDVVTVEGSESDEEFISLGPLRDWNMTFDHLRDLTFQVGQYKVPYSRQRVTSSGDLQMVDRSIANAEFNLDRDIGLDFRSEDFLGLDLLRYYAGVFIGEGRNTSQDSPGAGDFGLLYVARLELLPFGSFEDYAEADFERRRTPGLSIGAAYAFLDDAPRTRGILGDRLEDEVDFHNATADIMFKWRGLSATTALLYRKGEADAQESRSDGLGWMVQSGYLIPTTDLEVVGRYGLTRSLTDDDVEAVTTDENELGAGLNYYFAQHAFKLQADVFQLWEQSAGFGDGTTTVRVQLQASL